MACSILFQLRFLCFYMCFDGLFEKRCIKLSVCVSEVNVIKLNYALALKHIFYSNKQSKIVISAIIRKVQLKADLHTFVKHSFR